MAPSKKLGSGRQIPGSRGFAFPTLWIAAGIAGGLVLLYGPAFLRWVELNARHDQLTLEVTSLQRENQRLYEETRRLREDLSYAEAVARKELGLVRPGEKMVRFKTEQDGASR